MSELPAHFVAQESSNSDVASEQLPDPKFLQASLRAQTIQRFRALNHEIAAISDPQEQEAAQKKFDSLALNEYGKAWEALREPGVEVIPIVIGGKTGAELEAELTANRIEFYYWARAILHHPDFEANRLKDPTPMILVQLTVANLGFPRRGGTVDQIFATANTLGFTLCPPDAGPQLRLKSTSPSYKTIAMQPIIEQRDRTPKIFYLDRPAEDLVLDTTPARPQDRWFDDTLLVFCLPASTTEQTRISHD